MKPPKSDLNIAVMEGVLVADPQGRALAADSYVTEASIATTEQWMKKDQIQERTSYLGLVAHGPSGRILASLTKGTRVWVIGRWCTVEGPAGPRGGKTTSTKCRVIHVLPKLNEEALSLLIAAAANPESNLSASYSDQ